MNRIKFLHGDIKKPIKVEAMKGVSSHWESRPNDNYRREVGCFVLKVIYRRGDWNGLIIVRCINRMETIRMSRDYTTAERAIRYCDDFISKLQGAISEQE